MIQAIRDLFEYNRWAHARLQEVLGGLTPEQLTARVPSSFPSILATYAHIVAAEWIWLRRWRGESPTVFPEWLEAPSLPDLRERLRQIEADRTAWLDSLTDEAIERALDYRTLDGTPFRNRVSDLLLHVVNHTSYHRGQVVTMLHHVGAAAVATDFVLYQREQAPARQVPPEPTRPR
jgi:uncharacterized damage-inducible protein DinB